MPPATSSAESTPSVTYGDRPPLRAGPAPTRGTDHSDKLPELAATAAVEFLTGVLIDNSHPVDKPLRGETSPASTQPDEAPTACCTGSTTPPRKSSCCASSTAETPTAQPDSARDRNHGARPLARTSRPALRIGKCQRHHVPTSHHWRRAAAGAEHPTVTLGRLRPARPAGHQSPRSRARARCGTRRYEARSGTRAAASGSTNRGAAPFRQPSR